MFTIYFNACGVEQCYPVKLNQSTQQLSCRDNLYCCIQCTISIIQLYVMARFSSFVFNQIKVGKCICTGCDVLLLCFLTQVNSVMIEILPSCLIHREDHHIR